MDRNRHSTNKMKKKQNRYSLKKFVIDYPATTLTIYVLILYLLFGLFLFNLMFA